MTFCPLTGSGIVYDPVIPDIDAAPQNFGVSGLLFDNNLILFDRRTDSLWSQMPSRKYLRRLVGDKASAASRRAIYLGRLEGPISRDDRRQLQHGLQSQLRCLSLRRLRPNRQYAAFVPPDDGRPEAADEGERSRYPTRWGRACLLDDTYAGARATARNQRRRERPARARRFSRRLALGHSVRSKSGRQRGSSRGSRLRHRQGRGRGLSVRAARPPDGLDLESRRCRDFRPSRRRAPQRESRPSRRFGSRGPLSTSIPRFTFPAGTSEHGGLEDPALSKSLAPEEIARFFEELRQKVTKKTGLSTPEARSTGRGPQRRIDEYRDRNEIAYVPPWPHAGKNGSRAL